MLKFEVGAEAADTIKFWLEVDEDGDLCLWAQHPTDNIDSDPVRIAFVDAETGALGRVVFECSDCVPEWIAVEEEVDGDGGAAIEILEIAS